MTSLNPGDLAQNVRRGGLFTWPTLELDADGRVKGIEIVPNLRDGLDGSAPAIIISVIDPFYPSSSGYAYVLTEHTSGWLEANLLDRMERP